MKNAFVLLLLVNLSLAAASETRATQSRTARDAELRLVESVTILLPRVEARRVTGEGAERMPRFEEKLAVSLAGTAARTLAKKRFDVRPARLPVDREESARMQAERDALDAAWQGALRRLSAGEDIDEVSVGPAIHPLAARASTEALLLINYSGLTKADPHSDAAVDLALGLAGKLGRLAGEDVRRERVEMALIHAESGAILWYAAADNNRLSRQGATEAASAALKSLRPRPRRQISQELVRALQGIETIAVVPGSSHIVNSGDGGRDAALERTVTRDLAASVRELARKKGFVVSITSASAQPDALLAVRFSGVKRASGSDEQSSVVPVAIAATVLVVAIVASKSAPPAVPLGNCCAERLPASGMVELTLIDAENGGILWTGSAANYRMAAEQTVGEAMRTLPAKGRKHAAR